MFLAREQSSKCPNIPCSFPQIEPGKASAGESPHRALTHGADREFGICIHPLLIVSHEGRIWTNVEPLYEILWPLACSRRRPKEYQELVMQFQPPPEEAFCTPSCYHHFIPRGGFPCTYSLHSMLSLMSIVSSEHSAMNGLETTMASLTYYCMHHRTYFKAVRTCCSESCHPRIACPRHSCFSTLSHVKRNSFSQVLGHPGISRTLSPSLPPTSCYLRLSVFPSDNEVSPVPRWPRAFCACRRHLHLLLDGGPRR